MRRSLLVSLPILLAAAGACASTQSSPAGAPTDRVLTTDMQGQVIRQSALNDRATVTIAAPVDKVWPAVVATYAEIGIEANYADQANGHYGVRNYNFPRTLNGTRVGSFFSCGSSLTGAVVDAGTVNSEIVTTVTATPDGKTHAVIFVSGWVRRNEGNASNPIACASTGRLEEMIRTSVERKVASM
jgi:hypothetical protein